MAERIEQLVGVVVLVERAPVAELQGRIAVLIGRHAVFRREALLILTGAAGDSAVGVEEALVLPIDASVLDGEGVRHGRGQHGGADESGSESKTGRSQERHIGLSACRDG